MTEKEVFVKTPYYGKPDYQASATVISECQQVMAIMDEARNDDGTLEDPEHDKIFKLFPWVGAMENIVQ